MYGGLYLVMVVLVEPLGSTVVLVVDAVEPFGNTVVAVVVVLGIVTTGTGTVLVGGTYTVPFGIAPIKPSTISL